MHEMVIEDENGETLDVIKLCSDACHRDYAGDDYEGWSGCHETEFTDYCANCGVVLPGIDACDCQVSNVIVNRFLSEEGEKCSHGNWLQVPYSLIEGR